MDTTPPLPSEPLSSSGLAPPHPPVTLKNCARGCCRAPSNVARSERARGAIYLPSLPSAKPPPRRGGVDGVGGRTIIAEPTRLCSVSSGKVTLAGMAQCARGVGIWRMSTCLCGTVVGVVVVVVVERLLSILPEEIDATRQTDRQANKETRGHQRAGDAVKRVSEVWCVMCCDVMPVARRLVLRM